MGKRGPSREPSSASYQVKSLHEQFEKWFKERVERKAGVLVKYRTQMLLEDYNEWLEVRMGRIPQLAAADLSHFVVESPVTFGMLLHHKKIRNVHIGGYNHWIGIILRSKETLHQDTDTDDEEEIKDYEG